MINNKFLKSTICVIFFTVLSRITGFIRDSVMANYLGAGYVSDALVAAAKLPNSFRRLLAEGALSSTFVPMFSKSLSENKKHNAIIFASRIFFTLMLILLVIFVIFNLFMPFFVNLLSPGFKAVPEKLNLTVNLSRINFIFLITISLTALCGGILNSINKFSYFAATPIILNLGIVIAIIFSKDSTDVQIAYIISWTTIIMGFVQLILMMYGCKTNKLGIVATKPKMDHKMRLFLKKMSFGFIGSGIYQINIFVDTIFASLTTSGVSYLYYTDRVNQLPLTLIGGTLGIVLLPTISKYIKSKEFDKLFKLQDSCIVFGMYASAFCVASIFAFNKEITKFIYFRGKFSMNDVDVVRTMLMIFSIGLPFSILSKILTAHIFANGDTKTPMKIGMYCMIINVIINFASFKYLGYYCVVAATIISSVFSGLIPFFHLRKHKLLKINTSMSLKIACIIIIGMATYLLQIHLIKYLSYFITNEKISLMLAILFSGGFYILSSFITKIYSIQELMQIVKKNH